MGTLVRRIGIYKIENKVNGKVYIGQSVNIRKRFIEHRYRAYDKKDEDTYSLYLYTAIRKYGKENFAFSVVEECRPEELNDREKYWIAYYKSNLKEYGYNLSDGGDSKYSRNMTNSSNISAKKQRVGKIKDDLRNTDIEVQEIAKRYGVTDATVSSINRGKSWYCTDEQYPIRDTRRKTLYYCPKCGAKLSSKHSNLCKKCDSERQHLVRGNFPGVETLTEDVDNYGLTELAKKYGVSTTTICRWSKKYNIPLKGWNQKRRLKYEQVQQQRDE